MLFVSTLSKESGLDLNGDTLGSAAKLTFLNVILISLIFTVIDSLRRRWTVDRPVKRIAEAAEKMRQGIFDVRIAPVSGFATDGSFNEIIDCVNQMAEDPMSRLRRLDRGVAKRAQTVALIVGIPGSLILGTGMSLVMTD